MANITNIQILNDGPRNVVVKAVGILDTSDVSLTTLIDPSTLSKLGFDSTSPAPTRLIIDKISYNVEAGLAVNLFWDATSDVLITSLVSSGDDIFMKEYGGIYNTEAAGATGSILYSTSGWSASAVLSYTVILECRKK
jgi:hypothetical protein